MSKKNKTLIIILGALVLLGGGYYGATVWQAKKAAVPPAATAEPSPKIGNLDSSKLVKIEIPGIVLEKGGTAQEAVWELSSLNGEPPPDGIELEQSPIQSMTYSLASIWADRIVEEAPADLSIYGLVNPAVRAVITDSDGKTAVYLLGDMTPSRTSFYAMQEGDPKVYIISSYAAENMTFTLDNIRTKFLFPAFEVIDVTELRIETPTGRIEMIPKQEPAPPHLASTFAGHIITSPYKLVRGADAEALEELLTPLKDLSMDTVIEDRPGSLVPYGLDRPVRVFLKTKDEISIDLLIGNQAGTNRYAKLANAPAVFTVAGLDPFVNVKPFSLIDKFALLINIDHVDHLSVTGGGQPAINVEFEGKGEEGVYFINGKKTETKSFKAFYQAVIGLLSDAEYPGDSNAAGLTAVPAASSGGILDLVRNPADDGSGSVTIEYLLDNPAGVWASITLVPYNRDFYALRQDGTMEFLISRNQVRKIYETLDEIIYE